MSTVEKDSYMMRYSAREYFDRIKGPGATKADRVLCVEAHVQGQRVAAWNAAIHFAEQVCPGAALVLRERRRQIEHEGWTASHDDRHDAGELAAAASAYAVNAADQLSPHSQGDGNNEQPVMWPWGPDFWKPVSAMRDLERAGALVIAEIERLQRVGLDVKATKAEACPHGLISICPLCREAQA